MATAASPEVFALTDEQIVGLSAAESADTQEPAPQPAATNASSDTGLAAPSWLAERMRDPWHGDEAKDLWEGKQRVEKEIAAYREIFQTTDDAKALKAIYPGGLVEAKAAADRARELDAIDDAFLRGDSVARTQLAQRLMLQGPAAFREMVEAAQKLLTNSPQNNTSTSQPLAVQTPAAPGPEVTRAYADFERSANAELDHSVGNSIARTLEEALPNLRSTSARTSQGESNATSLRERLASAVRDELESALQSDRQLGEQVVRVLSGRRFDEASRKQVVRLIDARAQELVPHAVRRVVNSWTQTTLTPRAKGTTAETLRTEKTTPGRSRRVDYTRMSDDQILSL
jgi:hypothetical protein